MESYENMLKRAKEKLPEDIVAKERFEVPNVKGHIEGNKTIIVNFMVIVDKIGREPQHLLKFLQRELATPANIDSKRLILKRKIKASLINKKINDYVNDFVLCPECNKPDTKLIKEGIVLMKKCAACGAKHTVKAKI